MGAAECLDLVWMVRARREAKKVFGEEGQLVAQHAKMFAVAQRE